MSSPPANVQMINVSLSEADIAIEPGGAAHVMVTVTNGQDEPDWLSLEVEGVDVEWYSIPVSSANVAAGGVMTARINFKIAHASENRAGSYPFLVRARAMETGAAGVAQGTLLVKPYNALQVEIDPKRAVATFLHPLNDFDVRVSNEGNVEEALDLYASDPEDGCAYEFDTEHVVLKPGQSEVIGLAARPRVSALVGSPRLYGFNVSARSVKDGYVSGSSHGQIEKHALISPLLGIFLLLLASAAGGWALFRPHPPSPIRINSFHADTRSVVDGQKVTLTWDVTPTYRELILSHHVGTDGVQIVDGPLPAAAGHTAVIPGRPATTYSLEARGAAGQRTQSADVTIAVAPQPAPPKPVLSSFRADPAVIHQGDPVMLSWDGSGVTQFILDPGFIQLGPLSNSYQVTPNPIGDTEEVKYTLRPIGKNNAVGTSRSVRIRVAPKNVSIAEIDQFTAKPDAPYIGDNVRLKWRVSYARGVHIDADKGGPIGDEPHSGSVEVPISEPTTYTLTATDSSGLTTTRRLTVTPRVRPQLPEPNPNNPLGVPTPPTEGGTPPVAPTGQSTQPAQSPG